MLLVAILGLTMLLFKSGTVMLAVLFVYLVIRARQSGMIRVNFRSRGEPTFPLSPIVMALMAAFTMEQFPPWFRETSALGLLGCLLIWLGRRYRRSRRAEEALSDVVDIGGGHAELVPDLGGELPGTESEGLEAGGGGRGEDDAIELRPLAMARTVAGSDISLTSTGAVNASAAAAPTPTSVGLRRSRINVCVMTG